jgi:hypothetical protein
VKLRTTKNSIRLRLSQEDVRTFAEKGVIEERIDFGPSSTSALVYRLVRGREGSDVAVNFADSVLTVTVPSARADRWTSSGDVGIDAKQSTGNPNPLSILIEKDFACLTPRAGDDDKDSFPHPNAAGAC